MVSLQLDGKGELLCIRRTRTTGVRLHTANRLKTGEVPKAHTPMSLVVRESYRTVGCIAVLVGKYLIFRENNYGLWQYLVVRGILEQYSVSIREEIGCISFFFTRHLAS